MPLVVAGIIFFLIGGVFFKYFPPRKINHIYGWRTSFAMKNIDIWNEAQRYGANIFIIGGLINTFTGLLLYALWRSMHETIGLIAMFVSLAVILLIGELHLRQVFNKDGSRK